MKKTRRINCRDWSHSCSRNESKAQVRPNQDSMIRREKGVRRVPAKLKIRLLIMGPEPDDFHDFFFLQHLINKTVLNVDPSRICP